MSVILITGCSSGLGRALAETAIALGHVVIATARDPRMIAELEQLGRCTALPLDVTEPSSMDEAVATALKLYGRIDLLINNAGFALLGALEECNDAETLAVFETNLFGPLHLTRTVLPAMRDQCAGCIVNISAAAAIENYPGFALYGAAKAALDVAYDSLRQELSAFNIRVMSVQPGPFRTDFVVRSVHRAAASIPDYEATSGKFGRLIFSMHGKQPGDPLKAAHVILSAALRDEPPHRLVLGRYANAKLQRHNSRSEQERIAWETLSASTEFDRQ